MKTFYAFFIGLSASFLLKAQSISPTDKAGLTGGQLSTHSRVDIYHPDGSPRARATIVEVLKDTYKVHYDGCPATDDQVIQKALVKPAAILPDTVAEVASLMGKWIMFTPSYPSSYEEQRKMLNEYLSGSKEPPLLINADGSFVWYYQYGKPPYNGKWMTDAKVPGQERGIQSLNGIIIIDPEDHWYKLHPDQNGHLVAEQLCLGNSLMGSRIKH
jgi:hypothetical protein